MTNLTKQERGLIEFALVELFNKSKKEKCQVLCDMIKKTVKRLEHEQ